MIATALSPIGRDFGVGTADIAWLVSVMYLASAIAQPVAGRMADEFGGRRVFVAGCALVAVAGLVGALGMSLALLVVSRMMIGLGTALIYPAAVSMVRERAAEPLGMPSPTGPLRALNVATLIALMVGPPFGGGWWTYSDGRRCSLRICPWVLRVLRLACSSCRRLSLPPVTTLYGGRSTSRAC
ncbi:MFS family permease [Nocardioides aromaticivorans]|uniref:MFS family permease n=1 Tax=Nocardioides aromaticivorans TaxID=200618 RepID=A0A7Y9ZLT0_9ACTN|nr:MFS family permease [Nocardioides aromaticivorans]